MVLGGMGAQAQAPIPAQPEGGGRCPERQVMERDRGERRSVLDSWEPPAFTALFRGSICWLVCGPQKQRCNLSLHTAGTHG